MGALTPRIPRGIPAKYGQSRLPADNEKGLGSPPPTPTSSLQALARQNAGCPADPAYPASGISGSEWAGMGGALALGLVVIFAPEIAAALAARNAIPNDGTVARSVNDILDELRGGRTPPNLEVDTAGDLDKVFEELAQGGSPVQSSYPGKFVELADGTRIGLRQTSLSGGPTIDIFKSDGTYVKVHLP